MSLVIKQGPDCEGLLGCANEFGLPLGNGKHSVVLGRNVRYTVLLFKWSLWWPCRGWAGSQAGGKQGGQSRRPCVSPHRGSR